MSGGAAVTPGRAIRQLGFRLGYLVTRTSAFVSLIAASAALAADDNKIIFPKGSTGAPAPNAGGSVANTLTLLVAIVLAAAGAWLFWRNRNQPGLGRDGRHLSVEETRSLGNRQYLVVASYRDKKFLLGVCPGRIEMLAPLHDDTKEAPKS